MNREMLDTVEAALSRFTDEPELIELSPGETSLDFLQKVYRSTKQPMSRRMRAAIEAMSFESPKLAVIANVGEKGIGELLDAARERMRNGGGGKVVIDAKPVRELPKHLTEPKVTPSQARMPKPRRL